MKIRRFLPLLMLAMAAACEPSGTEMGTLTGPMPQAPPPLAVREQQRQLVLTLPRGGDLTVADWHRYDGLLLGVRQPQNIQLRISGDPSPRVTDALLRRAVQLGVGLEHISLAPPAPAAGPNMTVDIVAKVYVAVLPNCPQTEHLNTIDGDNTVGSDWGCASVSNLELMVANPRDLIEGESGGESDSVMTTAAITRLQTDKLKKLDTSTTTAPTGSTAAPAQ